MVFSLFLIFCKLRQSCCYQSSLILLQLLASDDTIVSFAERIRLHLDDTGWYFLLIDTYYLSPANDRSASLFRFTLSVFNVSRVDFLRFYFLGEESENAEKKRKKRVLLLHVGLENARGKTGRRFPRRTSGRATRSCLQRRLEGNKNTRSSNKGFVENVYVRRLVRSV